VGKPGGFGNGSDLLPCIVTSAAPAFSAHCAGRQQTRNGTKLANEATGDGTGCVWGCRPSVCHSGRGAHLQSKVQFNPVQPESKAQLNRKGTLKSKVQLVCTRWERMIRAIHGRRPTAGVLSASHESSGSATCRREMWSWFHAPTSRQLLCRCCPSRWMQEGVQRQAADRCSLCRPRAAVAVAATERAVPHWSRCSGLVLATVLATAAGTVRPLSAAAAVAARRAFTLTGCRQAYAAVAVQLQCRSKFWRGHSPRAGPRRRPVRSPGRNPPAGQAAAQKNSCSSAGKHVAQLSALGMPYCTEIFL